MAMGGLMLFFTAFFLTVLFGGDLTKSLRDSLGLTELLPERSGVYADCSLAENRNNKFCRRDYLSALKKPTPSTTFWQKPGDGPIFSLND
jgi:hypothetical protein